MTPGRELARVPLNLNVPFFRLGLNNLNNAFDVLLSSMFVSPYQQLSSFVQLEIHLSTHHLIVHPKTSLEYLR